MQISESLLAELKIKFTHWRKRRVVANEHIPKDLWIAVKQALHHIAAATICRELNVSYLQLQQNCNFIRDKSKIDHKRHGFVKIAPQERIISKTCQSFSAPLARAANSEIVELSFAMDNLHEIKIKLPADKLTFTLLALKKIL